MQSPKFPKGAHSKGRYATVGANGFRGAVSYRDIAPELLQRVICAVVEAGDAVTFGRTSDGGAYFVGALCDGILNKWYLDSPEACVEALEGLCVAAEALVV